MKEKQNAISKTHTYPPALYEKLKQLQEDKSFPTITATLHYCIIEAYERSIRNEKRVRKNVPDEDKLSIDERRKEREEEEQREIAKRLEGKVVSQHGSLNVEYMKHSKQGSYPQSVPLSTMHEQIIKDQYFPTRKIVEDYWKKKEAKKEAEAAEGIAEDSEK